VVLQSLIDLNFLSEEKAEETYDKYIDENGCAAMYKVLPGRLELVKQEAEF